jgi:hypothetical protein
MGTLSLLSICHFCFLLYNCVLCLWVWNISFCVHCFLAKRNKIDREENNKVKNKSFGMRGWLRILHGLETQEVSCKGAVA